MGIFIGMVGILGFLVCLALLVVALIKKNEKKKYLIGLGVTFAMFILGVAITPTSSETTTEEPEKTTDVVEIIEEPEASKEVAEVPAFGELVEYDVLNGTQTEKIGTYVAANTNGVEITQENLVAFYNDNVVNSQHNWVTLMIDDSTGLHFTGNVFAYAIIAEDGSIEKTLGTGFIVDDSIDYTSFDGKDDVKANVEAALAEYNVTTLDILTLAEGSFSASIQMQSTLEKADMTEDEVVEFCQEVATKIQGMAEEFRLEIIDAKMQLVIMYDSDDTYMYFE